MSFKSVKIQNLKKTKSENIDMEYIAKGGYAEVYKNKAGHIISFVDIDDKSRFYVSQVKGDFIPNITFLGSCYINGQLKDVYISEQYFSAENNFLAQELCIQFNFFANSFEGKIQEHNKLLIAYLENKIKNSELIQEIKSIYNKLIEAKDFYILEFPIHNLMQNSKGQLILLDIAYKYTD